MRKTWRVVGALGLLLTLGGPLWSGDPAAARALIDKAIQAQGGADKLARFHSAVLKGNGTYYGGSNEGKGIEFTGVWTAQGSDKMRMHLTLKTAAADLSRITVVNGAKGWTKFGKDPASPMPKDELAEERERTYATWVATLVPLKDKAFELKPAAEAKVGGRAAQGVRVSRKGHRDITLYFDKDSGLLVKSEMMIKKVDDGSNAKLQQEVFYSDYKDFGGARWPSRVRILQGGKRFVEVNFTEAQAKEKLDDKVFAEP
jgi:hypothetical protein